MRLGIIQVEQGNFKYFEAKINLRLSIRLTILIFNNANKLNVITCKLYKLSAKYRKSV